MVKKIPDGYQSIAPYLVVSDVEAAIDFYVEAFGALEDVCLTMPDDTIGHAEVKIGNSTVMLGGADDKMKAHAPAHYGGSPASVFLYVEDVDATFKKAVEAGGKEQQAPKDMFWGDRMAKIVDPFGYTWSVATHVEDVSHDEMEKRMEELYG